jgi:predicted unusual protein kinase regulating ubiquinone biosynthesis (AarF/ABC1/UbiB family)
MKEQLEVVRQRFTEELDYGLEAERLSMFAGFHEGDREIRLPRVHPQRTARRVLTTDLMHGATFDEACRAPESDRRRWAETLWRFVFKGNLVHGHFNADPHPGNYLFCPAGTVVFLDFGCVQPIEAANLHCARALHRAAMALDERAFADAVIRLLAAPPGALQRKAIGFMRRCFEPLFHRPYRMTRAYVSSIVDELRSLAADARRADDVEFFALPADMLFMNRLQFGFYSVLARLDVEVDYSAIERRFWPEVDR